MRDILIPTYHMKWSDERVLEYYDTHLNQTLRELSDKSGHSVDKLKEILLSR